MAKSRSNRKSVINTITKRTKEALPVLGKGLKTIGKTAKNVTSASAPVLEEGLSVVYRTMAQGFDLGVKGVKSVAKGVKMTKKRRHKKGGRRKSRK